MKCETHWAIVSHGIYFFFVRSSLEWISGGRCDHLDGRAQVFFIGDAESMRSPTKKIQKRIMPFRFQATVAILLAKILSHQRCSRKVAESIGSTTAFSRRSSRVQTTDYAMAAFEIRYRGQVIEMTGRKSRSRRTYSLQLSACVRNCVRIFTPYLDPKY